MLSVLLMIRINHTQRRVMGGRKVPCLDDYLDRVQLLLWPRFKVRRGGGWVGESGSNGRERHTLKQSYNHTHVHTSALVHPTMYSCT